MKTILALCLAIVTGGAFLVWRSMQMPDEFGIFTGAPAIPVSDLVERPEDFLGKPVKVEGRIYQQCRTMGCYFFLRSPNGNLRVDLQEIAMNAPMREGHETRVEGQMVPYGGAYQLFASAVQFK
jgi:hypothetical protein